VEIERPLGNAIEFGKPALGIALEAFNKSLAKFFSNNYCILSLFNFLGSFLIS
jgi:hypothetical protein